MTDVDGLPATPPAASRRRRETRDRLLGAAQEVFAERGLEAASVELICERAGFTRGAFYSNFSAKEELLFELAAREQAERVERLERLLAEALNDQATMTLDAAVATVLDGFLQLNPPTRSWFMLRRELQVQALRDDRIAVLLAQAEDENFAQLARLVVVALARVGRRPRLDPGDFVRLIAGVFECSLQDEFQSAPAATASADLAKRILPGLIVRLTDEIAPPSSSM